MVSWSRLSAASQGPRQIREGNCHIPDCCHIPGQQLSDFASGYTLPHPPEEHCSTRARGMGSSSQYHADNSAAGRGHAPRAQNWKYQVFTWYFTCQENDHVVVKSSNTVRNIVLPAPYLCPAVLRHISLSFPKHTVSLYQGSSEVASIWVTQ